MPAVTPRVRIPTADELCTEGFQRVAGRPPTSEQLDRAVKQWLEEVLVTVWQAATHQDITRFKPLENTAVMVLTKGQRRYDLPEDFHRPICATLLEGSLTGEVADEDDLDGTYVPEDGGTILPAANSGDLEDYFSGTAPHYQLSGNWVVMTSGPAVGTIREIVSVTDYIAVSFNVVHLMSLDAEWVTPEIPAEGDTFFIAEERGLWVDNDMMEKVDRNMGRSGLGLPISFSEFDRTFELDVAPDADNYAVVLRYWSNPLKMDKESSNFESLLTNWRSVVTKGIAYMAAESLDDGRAKDFEARFLAAVGSLVEHEYDRGPTFQGFRLG